MGEIPRSFIDEVEVFLPPGSLVVYPDLDMGFFSLAQPEDLAADVDALVTDLVAEHDPGQVILIGFSTGTLIARAAVLAALARERKGEVTWRQRLDRVVMLAGILRGWSVTSVTPPRYRLQEPVMRMAVFLRSWLHSRAISPRCRRRRPLGELTERGEPFVVEQRLRFEAGLPELADVAFIYILGTRDDIVSPADAIDIGPRPNFYFLELPGADHLTIIDPTRNPKRGKSDPEARRGVLRLAIQGSHGSLADFRLPDDHIDDYLDPMDLPLRHGGSSKVKHVTIVLHGIRDDGFWTKRIGGRIKGRGGEGVLRTPTPTYGFLSIVGFLRLYTRYGKVRWFLEQYADVRTLYPGAEVSFVGHSNGTFLAAQAMELCPSVRFKRIYFAGSVVRTDYPWRLRAGQVTDRVVNVTASDDYIVALAPGLMEWLKLKFMEVGGAGHSGFQGDHGMTLVENVGPFAGGHSAGIDADFWDPIADFVRGEPFAPPREPDGGPTARRIRLWRCVIVVALVLLVLGSIGLAGIWMATGHWIWFLALVAMWYAVVHVLRFF